MFFGLVQPLGSEVSPLRYSPAMADTDVPLGEAPFHHIEEQRVETLRVRRRWLRVGLAFATLLGIAGMMLLITQAFESRRTIRLAQLRSDPPVGRFIEVSCDQVIGPVWEEVYRSLTGTRAAEKGPISRIVLCELGGYYLPVKLDADAPLPTKVVHGKLLPLQQDLLMREGVQSDPEIAPKVLGLYLNGKSAWWFYLLVGAGMVLVALGTAVFYARWTRKHRAVLV